MRPTTRLRQLLARDEILVAPGAWDGLSARLVARAGFEAVYATGGGIARSAGYPDLGLLGMSTPWRQRNRRAGEMPTWMQVARRNSELHSRVSVRSRVSCRNFWRAAMRRIRFRRKRQKTSISRGAICPGKR
jgi:hypothetical protein